jgi:hypothetical protein
VKLGETLSFTDGSVHTAKVLSSNAFFGAQSFIIQPGVFYINGYFVYSGKQILILNKYSRLGNYRLGFDVSETIVDAGDDPTLLDPARGSYNYAAPGADRLKISIALTAYSSGDTVGDNFIEIAQVVDGVLTENKITTTDYSYIMDTMARRTYDESGNYTVKPFKISLHEAFNTAQLSANVTAGVITGINIDFPGLKYISYHPDVIIEGSGTGATAVATIDKETGKIDTIVVSNGGSGYDSSTTKVSVVDPAMDMSMKLLLLFH